MYSNQQIRQAVQDGHIIIEPFNDKHIAGSSVDVTLGHYYFKVEDHQEPRVYNPFDEKEVQRYFSGPFEAIPHQAWIKERGIPKFANIPPNHPVIVLRPGERILAHTHEFIGIKAPGTSTMQARSTWGRNGVAVCLDAGWGDPGYINRWTMEICNINQYEAVVLPVGERIAQLVFYETGEVDGEYTKLSGKYQLSGSLDLKKVIANWTPQQMLPRAYKDTRILPTPIKGLRKDLK